MICKFCLQKYYQDELKFKVSVIRDISIEKELHFLNDDSFSICSDCVQTAHDKLKMNFCDLKNAEDNYLELGNYFSKDVIYQLLSSNFEDEEVFTLAGVHYRAKDINSFYKIFGCVSKKAYKDLRKAIKETRNELDMSINEIVLYRLNEEIEMNIAKKRGYFTISSIARLVGRSSQFVKKRVSCYEYESFNRIIEELRR